MLPEYVFNKANLKCFFFEGPIDIVQMKDLSRFLLKTTEIDYLRGTQVNVDHNGVQLLPEFYTDGISAWLYNIEEFNVGTIEGMQFAIHYDVGWELVICAVSDVSALLQLSMFTVQTAWLWQRFWNLDELIASRIEMTSQAQTSSFVRNWCEELRHNYQSNAVYIEKLS